MRQFGELEAVIMNRLWARDRPALVGRPWMTCKKRPADRVHDGHDRDGQLVPQGVAAPTPGRPGRWDRTGAAARDPDWVQPTWQSAHVTQVMRYR